MTNTLTVTVYGFDGSELWSTTNATEAVHHEADCWLIRYDGGREFHAWAMPISIITNGQTGIFIYGGSDKEKIINQIRETLSESHTLTNYNGYIIELATYTNTLNAKDVKSLHEYARQKYSGMGWAEAWTWGTLGALMCALVYWFMSIRNKK